MHSLAGRRLLWKRGWRIAATWGVDGGVARGAGGCGRLSSHCLAQPRQHEEVELMGVLLLMPRQLVCCMLPPTPQELGRAVRVPLPRIRC